MTKSDLYSFKNYSFKGVGIFYIAIGLFFFIGIWVDNGVNLFKSWGCLFPILILLIFVVIGAVQLYYIELNEKELVVKNTKVLKYLLFVITLKEEEKALKKELR